MTAPNPAQVAALVGFRKQGERIASEQERRAKLRAMRVKTPLTRNELAAMARVRENS